MSSRYPQGNSFHRSRPNSVYVPQNGPWVVRHGLLYYNIGVHEWGSWRKRSPTFVNAGPHSRAPKNKRIFDGHWQTEKEIMYGLCSFMIHFAIFNLYHTFYPQKWYENVICVGIRLVCYVVLFVFECLCVYVYVCACECVCPCVCPCVCLCVRVIEIRDESQICEEHLISVRWTNM